MHLSTKKKRREMNRGLSQYMENSRWLCKLTPGNTVLYSTPNHLEQSNETARGEGVTKHVRVDRHRQWQNNENTSRSITYCTVHTLCEIITAGSVPSHPSHAAHGHHRADGLDTVNGLEPEYNKKKLTEQIEHQFDTPVT